MTALEALVLGVLVVARFNPSSMRFPQDILAPEANLLLAMHTFSVILGYTLTLLIGGLGICFVSQRCLEDFSTSRLHSIGRVSFVLGSVGLLFTTAGVLLGMVWAKIEWGRYWAWDSKEIGGLSVVIWLSGYVIAHRFFKNSARGVLAISMLGNIVASLAWFGPQANRLHQYGMPNTSLLLTVAALVNLAFFLVGLAPAGWLRLRKAPR
jgi:ABC-type transport system involved in cytochrome c biogenesis permease subunit